MSDAVIGHERALELEPVGDGDLSGHDVVPRGAPVEVRQDVSAMYLGACSARPRRRSSTRAGLITREQYNAARSRYGGMWNYCGD